MNAFTIRDLENLSGIKAHTIRIWEQRYSFLKPKRSSTNIRYYDNEELKTVLNVALLNRHGFKISHIDRMSPETMREKILALGTPEAQHEILINGLLQCMIELEPEGFEEIIDNYIHNNGIDRTISQVIFPFLDKIGILWMTDHVRVAQEHLVSNVIRQKLILGLEKVSNLQMGSKTVVLFLPEGELHELGLLYVSYLLKIRGTKLIYLGANLPMDELEFIVKYKKPDYLYTHLTSLPARFSLQKYFSQVEARLDSTPLVLSGAPAREFRGPVPPNVLLKHSIDDVVAELS